MREFTANSFDFAAESPESKKQPDYEVTRISDGLGFGEGAISGEEDPEVLRIADETIQTKEILTEISRDEHNKPIQDDGCGDGRGVNLIYRFTEFFSRSLDRAKVFGGAVAMVGAGLIGTGHAKGTTEETFSDATQELKEKGLEFGAHTDENASGENSGCGAIDNAPQIVHAAIKHERQIRQTIESLDADTTELDTVYDNLHNFVDGLPADEKYSGKRVMSKIFNAGKVIKQLAGKHHEKFIILNTVRNYTVDQGLVREKTHGKAQVFAVDIWRLDDIAAGMYPDDSQPKSQAYLSELIYTLATAAVLTKGDLPVYLVA